MKKINLLLLMAVTILSACSSKNQIDMESSVNDIQVVNEKQEGGNVATSNQEPVDKKPTALNFVRTLDGKVEVLNENRLVVTKDGIMSLYDTNFELIKELGEVFLGNNTSVYLGDEVAVFHEFKDEIQGESGLIDMDGNIILESMEFFELFTLLQESMGGSKEQLDDFCRNELCGMMKYDSSGEGEMIIEAKYEDIRLSSTSAQFKFHAFKQNGLWGILDLDDNVVVEPIYREVVYIPSEYEKDYFEVTIASGEKGVFSLGKGWVLKPQVNQGSQISIFREYIVVDNKIYDQSENIVFETNAVLNIEESSSMQPAEDIIRVSINNELGVLNSDLNWVLEPTDEFNGVYSIANEFIVIISGDRMNITDIYTKDGVFLKRFEGFVDDILFGEKYLISGSDVYEVISN